MSCAEHYDVIYHPFPINSQYLKTWGVDSSAFSGCSTVMLKIVKTQNNTHTTIPKWTNNGFPNIKKPHTEFNGYRYYFSTVSHHNFISSTPAQIWFKHKDCTRMHSASENILFCADENMFLMMKSDLVTMHWLRWSCFSSLCPLTSKKMVNINFLKWPLWFLVDDVGFLSIQYFLLWFQE